MELRASSSGLHHAPGSRRNDGFALEQTSGQAVTRLDMVAGQACRLGVCEAWQRHAREPRAEDVTHLGNAASPAGGTRTGSQARNSRGNPSVRGPSVFDSTGPTKHVSTGCKRNLEEPVQSGTPSAGFTRTPYECGWRRCLPEAVSRGRGAGPAHRRPGVRGEPRGDHVLHRSYFIYFQPNPIIKYYKIEITNINCISLLSCN